MSATAPLVARLGDDPSLDTVLDAFVDHVTDQDLELYPAQEEAILEMLEGHNVILTTPTGSGKSLVAEAAHLIGLATDRRSFYTAPIKALVSEKFFALCHTFGSDRVGMITGDASVNAGAPIICCTAEIVANMVLREGAAADIDILIADEFHFYADPQRGWAWQIPLLGLPATQFLLMSATLGPTDFFCTDLTARSGRPTVEVTSHERPVPLEFEYRTTTQHTSLRELLDLDRAPVYLVHFTQRAATEAAQALTSLDVLTKDEKAAINQAIAGFRFDSPIGKDLRRWISHGVGVHHAGLLPRYRLLVEQLAQQGRLKLICGTDTLGVGVNVPIRTVLFTQLCKYDGTTTRQLTNREFQQIAGRAGRRGFDDIGYVWVQAPPHVVDNIVAAKKAATDAKKRRKLIKKKPPERGYVHWDEQTFAKLRDGKPEALRSSFAVSHHLLLEVLDRPGDGCADLRHLLVDNHETRRRQRRHIRQAIAMYRSLINAEVIEQLPEADDQGRRVRVTIDLQDDFALHQPLSLFALEAIGALDSDSPDHAVEVLSVVESVLENPGVILAAQINQAKGDLVTELKMAGIEYEERMERLAEVTHPKPLADFLYVAFDVFRSHHPWVGNENVAPKSIVRDLYERAMTFREYINHYGLKRSEGVVLRYLSETYKGMVQNVPEPAKTDAVYDLTEWLGELTRQIDSSLLDEWDRIANPEPEATDLRPPGAERTDVTTNRRAFTVMIRNELFRWITLLARRSHFDLAEVLARHGDGDWTADRLTEAMAAYWDEFDQIIIDTDARSGDNITVDHGQQSWAVTQIITDPEDHREWRLQGEVDLDASRQAGEAVIHLRSIERL